MSKKGGVVSRSRGLLAVSFDVFAFEGIFAEEYCWLCFFVRLDIANDPVEWVMVFALFQGI